MRLALLLCIACSGCDVLFELQHVDTPGDARGSADAGSDAAVDTPNLVFVTSKQYVPGNLGSVQAADAECASLAAAAGHPGRYVAWLSSSTSNAPSRIGAGARGWLRPDGRPFADTLVDIVQGRVWYPLRITEAGADVTASGLDSDLVVATATNTDGSQGTDTCNDFTNPAALVGIEGGLADNAPYGWGSLSAAFCSTPARLYCFEIDHDTPVALVRESTRGAFVLELDVTSGGGLAAFDQECAREIRAAGLPGTYQAALATTAAAAISRFTPGDPWVRPDGVTVVDRDGAFVAPIELGLGQEVEGPLVAWSGAQSLTAKSPGSAASCFDWTHSDATQALTGNDSRSGNQAFGAIANGCNIGARVYCLQE